MSEILEIDGSVLEGGGQILRISISLSAILGVPVRVTNIRAGRSKPGLAAQHLKGIELAAQLCQARLKGASIGSTQIEFIPGKIRCGNYQADTKTAGSISLLIQVALPIALVGDGAVTLDLRGGTNAEMAPQVDYIGEVFRYMLNKFGADFAMDVHRRGYFPKGGGHVTIEVSPVRKLNAVTLTDRGDVDSVHGWSYVAGVLPVKIANDMAEGARQALREAININIECYKEDRNIAPDNCSGIILCCTSSKGCVLGSDGLGRRGADPRGVGRGAGEALLRDILADVCADQHAQDQLIIYMALAEGKSSILVGEVTLHTKTAIHIAEIITKDQLIIYMALAEGKSSILVGEVTLHTKTAIHIAEIITKDQLIIYMALAEGKSSILVGEVTLHTKTAIHIAEIITKTKFSIQPVSDKTNIIECTGIGYVNKNLPPD